MALSKLWNVPTLQNVIQGYYWRQNELKVGKGPNFKPTVCDFASFLEEDIRETWNFANLGNTLLSFVRIKKKDQIQYLCFVQFESRSLREMLISELFPNSEKQCNEVFNICSCKCKSSFDHTIDEESFPGTDQWRMIII